MGRIANMDIQTTLKMSNEVSIFDDEYYFVDGKSIYRNLDVSLDSMNTPCTVVRCCIAHQKPEGNWVRDNITTLRNTTQLYRIGDVVYFGRL